MSKNNDVIFFKKEKSDFIDSYSLIKKLEKEILPERGYISDISENWNNLIKSDLINEKQQHLIVEKTHPTCLKYNKKFGCYTLYIKCKQSEIRSMILNNKDRIISNINSMFDKVVVNKIKFE